jgi:large subunit ribosomal protein L25
MAKTATVEALRRDRRGKGAARSARREGRIPAVLYGHGEDSLSLTVDGRRFERMLHEISVENTLLDLALDGEPARKVLVREIQRHPHRDEILHVDFFHVSMQEKITLEVPVVLSGTPSGVRLHGGILDHGMRDIEVLCLPSDIPEKVEIDVSHLEIGQSVRISDLTIPNAQILGDPERSVVSVVPPTVMEEPVVEAEVVAEGAEPEVIARGKEEEAPAGPGGKEKASAAPAGKEKAPAAKEKAPAGGKEKK